MGGRCLWTITLEDIFYFGFASIPNDAPKELDPFGIIAVRWNVEAQFLWHALVSVETGPVADRSPTFRACNIAFMAKGWRPN